MIHVFLFELRSLARGFAVAAVALLGLLVLFVGGAYPIYRDAKPQVMAILDDFPPQFAAAFGVSDDIFTFAGFYRFSYLYLALIAAIAAGSWGLGSFSRERRAKTLDFLLTMPVGRGGVFAAKLFACLTGVAVVGALYVGALQLVATAVDDGAGVEAGHLAVASLAVPGVAVVFLAFGALLGVALRRVRSVPGIATGLGVMGFATASLPGLTGEDSWRAIAPFLYFSQDTALGEGRFETGWLVAAAAVAVCCFAVSWVLFVRKDVRAR
ncbi:ABC transporter permease [Bifidobacterium lemurum]|uniref:ABC transporter permease n=1 Tax=Bifidobacterium lemurum TaxID=1603886 RepID=A0A261FU76_9BIFI|nr:ABC transporter permease subunit [Bifidobacterium lemurum]OZG62727.1 ABC transporter permease [Bifidobacterium lemurum]QOL34560.1 ABC transporter permease subunit [Bifidobacterium lemurum]